MSRLPVGALSLALLLSGVGCSAPSPGLRVQARVEEDVVIVAVPALMVPTVNVNAGFVEADSPKATTALQQLGSFPGVASVAVGEGDTVAVGQELARLDDAMLAAGVKSAQADAAAARAQIGVVDAGIDTTYDKDAEIADKRGDVHDAIDQLKDTRTTLKANRKTLLTQRDKLDDQLDEAKKALQLLPPEGTTPWPPGVPTREAVEAGIQALKAGLKQMDAALKQMNAGLGKLDDGLQKANEGLDKLDDATDSVSDARAQLIRLRRLVVVAADLSDVVVAIAKAHRGEGTVTSPANGVVTKVATVGQHLSPGAALVTLRRSGYPTMTTWLSPTQAAAVCLDDPATVQADWMDPGASVQARVTRIASRADFPPTSQATDEVHLTRAFAVWLTSYVALPAGTPVTVTIRPCGEIP